MEEKMKIAIEISNCKQCPYLHKERVFGEDSFEQGYDWLCKKSENAIIEPFVQAFEESKVEVPDWCPMQLEDEENVPTIKSDGKPTFLPKDFMNEYCKEVSEYYSNEMKKLSKK
jgi:hypothetical protein